MYSEKKIEIDSDNKIEYKILNIKYIKKRCTLCELNI